MTWLTRAWGLVAGLSVQTWIIVAAVIAFGAWSWQCYSIGYSNADQLWKNKALESRIAKLELELKIQQEADALDDKYRTELADENEQQKKVIDDYINELQSRPDKCLLGPDADRLQ